MRPLTGEIRLHADAEALAREGAAEFGEAARAAVEGRGRFDAVLTGGSSPVRLYELLADPGVTGEMPWRAIHLFWGDERMVPPGHPRSNYGMAERAFLSRVPIPEENVHRIRGELGVDEAARLLEEELIAHFGGGAPRFDLVHLGLGADGHVASLFPFARDLLLERGRSASPALLAEIGEWRVTLTLPALRSARAIEFLLPDASKSRIARRAILGPLDPFHIPAQAVRAPRGSLLWRVTAELAHAAGLTQGSDSTSTAGRAARRSHPVSSVQPPTNPGSAHMSEATSAHDIRQIAHGEHANPFGVLGVHRSPSNPELRVIRAFVPDAAAVTAIFEGAAGEVPLERVHPSGFFAGAVPEGAAERYRFRAEWEGGHTHEFDDPYRFPPTLGDLDLHLLGEGTDLRMYHKLGAHPHTSDGVEGVRFAVWAPNAQRVSVVGDFNGWDGRRHVMRLHPGVGVWDIFLPGVRPGAVYKFEIKPRHGAPFLKSDPLAFSSEVRPATASIVHELGRFEWSDEGWLRQRDESRPTEEAMLVYEVHLGSWRWKDGRPMTYRELAAELGDYVQEMGFTHVELMPVMEHPYDPSWGYQVTGYFAPTSRFGSPDDFKFLVDELHRRGIGVILDWVPAHFPRDASGLRQFDGTPLYEHQDPRQGEHPDWGTMIFNYGRNEVRNFLVSNALFWMDEYHVDGLRVDAVASMLYLDYSRKEGEWLPNRHGGRENLEAIDFFRALNQTVRDRHPGAVMIAEESTAWPGVTQPAEEGGLGFHLKWNMGWMNDFLRFIEHDSVYRKYHFGLLTFSLVYAFSERFVLPFSHDEVVHGKRSLLDKMPGDEWQKFANMRLSLGFMWTHPGKQLLFMGGEFGQWREWTESTSLDWHLLERPLHRGLQSWVRDLNRLYRESPALWERDSTYEGFEWIDFNDVENTILSFVRRGNDPGEEVVVVCNFTPVPRHDYRIGVGRPGYYREMINSDAEFYGGSNLGNGGGVTAEEVPDHGRPYSLRLTLPPLGILILRREGGDDG